MEFKISSCLMPSVLAGFSPKPNDSLRFYGKNKKSLKNLKIRARTNEKRKRSEKRETYIKGKGKKANLK